METDVQGGLLRLHLAGPAPLAVTTPIGTSWYAHDAAGNISDQLSSAGTQWRFAYQPFGTLLA